jgi:hypothetical protein
MNTTFWALLLKPFIGIAYVAGLLVATRLVAEVLWRFLPESRAKSYLFRGWKGGDTQGAARGVHRVFKGKSILRRKPGE